MILYILFLFLHVLFAIFWVGGMLYLPLIMLPSIKKYPQRMEIIIKSGLKFRNYGWISLLGLFLTGLSIVYFRGMIWSIDFLFNTALGKILFLKLIVFLLVVIMLIIHDLFIGNFLINPSNQYNEYLIKIAKFTGKINLILSLLVVLLGILISRNITF